MADKTDKNKNKESCDCDVCNEDRRRRELVPLWDYVRTYLKFHGIHYDENQVPGSPEKDA